MKEHPVPTLEEQLEHKALRVIYEAEEAMNASELCGDCPLEGRPSSLAAREWAFAPSEPIEPDTVPKGEPSMVDKDIALACLSRFKRGICKQPNPVKGE